MSTITNHNAWLYASYTYQQEREWKALRERLRVLVLSGAGLQSDGRTQVYGVRGFIK